MASGNSNAADAMESLLLLHGLKILLDETAKNGALAALHRAHATDDEDDALEAVRNLPDVNARSRNELTALMISSDGGFDRCVQSLLGKNANVNAKEEDNWTALMFASQRGHSRIVAMLLRRGADVNAREQKGGGSALIIAAQNGHRQCVNLLAQAGANLNARTNQGATAAMMAAINGHHDVARMLGGGGAVRVQTSQSCTII